MNGDIELLSRVVRIANATTFDYPRSFKSILRFLVKELGLTEACFLLYDARQENFSQIISALEPRLFRSCPPKVNHKFEKTALQHRQVLQQNGKIYFPVFNRRLNYGILLLDSSPEKPLPKTTLDVLTVVCEELAGLAHGFIFGEERRRVGQLVLLSDLGRALNQARTFRDLLKAADRTVLRHNHACCLILHPAEGMPRSRSYARISPECRHLRADFIALEKKYSAEALEKGQPIFNLNFARSMELPAPLPPAMVTIPLKFQERMLGTLTLFGGKGKRGTGVPLTFDSESKRFFSSIGSQIAHALERVTALERLKRVSAENDRKLQETSLLFRISRAMCSTLNLNELIHLVLSATAVPGGGGFERAMLFMVNERSRTLQGMLGVTRESATLVFPPEKGMAAWENPLINSEVQQAQRQGAFCRSVMKKRFSLDDEENVLVRTVREKRGLFVSKTELDAVSAEALGDVLQLGSCACAPLLGRDRPLGVLVADNPDSKEEVTSDRLHFLELFAARAGTAMENSMLLHRLEAAHQDLRETQERLVQGEKMAVLGELAASVAHELKNPLVSIGGFAQRLSRGVANDGKSREYAAIIAREVRSMEKMLSNILGFSKKQMLCFSECDITEIIESALALEAETLEKGDISLVMDLADDLPMIRADAPKLRQVIINLIANGIQVMKEGGTLTVRTSNASLRGNDAVVVEVGDTGGGIPKDVMLNIFNPFFTTKDKGTGLGLSISHRIIEQHRGEINVENRGEGAVFSICLPVKGPGFYG